MKDFDVQRSERPVKPADERSFKIGGEVFVMRDVVRPDALAGADKIREPELHHTECQCGHHRSRHEHAADRCLETDCDCQAFNGKVVAAGSSITETLEALDGTILGMIENGEPGGEAEVRYRALRARENDPILIDDLTDVIKWLMEEQTRRPTTPPSSSTTSRSRTGKPSTASSSSPVLAAA